MIAELINQKRRVKKFWILSEVSSREKSLNFSRKRTNRNVLVEIQLVTVKTIIITAFLGLFFL